jgi:hypothetical protein
MSFRLPDEYRQPHPIFQIMGDEGNGFFVFLRNGVWFKCLASNGMGWEHVSVSLYKRRCPTWDEMCMVKELFWDADDCVIQFHPTRNENISMHDFCLHLWRPIEKEFPRPDSIMVGFK